MGILRLLITAIFMIGAVNAHAEIGSIAGYRWQYYLSTTGPYYPSAEVACRTIAGSVPIKYITPTVPGEYACWFDIGGYDSNFFVDLDSSGCADGYTRQADKSCAPSTPEVKACPVSHPVYPGTGAKTLTERDDAGSEELPISRTYRSDLRFRTNGAAGGWMFNWQRAVDVAVVNSYSSSPITTLRDGGTVRVFSKSGTVWTTSGIRDTIEHVGSNWVYKAPTEGIEETYDAQGNLLSVRERNGRTTALQYTTTGQLTKVTAPSGRNLTFGYNAQGRVSSITAPDGAITQYAYNANGMLTTVTWPDNTTRQYVYEDTRFPTALTGVIDEAGVRYATYAYDDQGRAITSELTAGADRYQFQYQANGQTTVLTPDGGSSVYSFLKQNGVLLPTGVSAPCPTCGNTALSTSYDSNNNATSKTGYDGSTTSYTYDTLGRETQRIEGAGTANAKTTTTEWDPQQWLVTRVAAPNKIEAFSYDANGNLLSHTVTPTGDANGSQGFGAAASGPVQRTDWTYDDSGHVLTATERTDGAVTGTWTLTYDGQGNLLTLTNPDGKTGRITLYDAAGRVLEAVDVNGIAVKLAYNARGWVTAYDYGEQHIRYEYDAIGQRTAMVGPQNLVMRYVYDAAHRLTQILDNIPTAQSDTSAQTASPFATTATKRSATQSIGDMVRHGWNAMLAWVKRQLAGLIASAHAQVIPVPGAGGSVLPPIPNVSLPIKGPQYPEDSIDPNAGAVMSKTRPPGMSSLEERHYDRTCANSQDPCVALKASAQKAIAQAKVKMNNMLCDTMLYKYAYDTPNPAVTGTNTTWKGHADDLDGRISNIWAMISLGRKMGCDMSAETAAAMTLLTPGAPL
ncbi:RHS repeat domain-containing protein [Ralstonia mojiangensis]|uniref:RHS repeat domain-containing protein n=1 Tax=Ralstonia mojiangensis TaxID=2953895 RepID=UPI0020903A49|nr:RHS repeat domain-containing protein [Ralstonia mojiangensis]MCO5411217.1 RHS repeat protein [Ralstonia mojiangensis]